MRWCPISDVLRQSSDVRCGGLSRPKTAAPEYRILTDIVAKVENRATRKISRKLIFGLLRRCVALADILALRFQWQLGTSLPFQSPRTK